MRRILILGSTGSIGTQALEVIAARPEQFRVVALTAGGGQLALLADQVRAFAPRFVAVPTAAAAAELRALIGDADVEIAAEGGNEAAARLDADVVLNAITGAAGLLATLATVISDPTERTLTVLDGMPTEAATGPWRTLKL